MRRSHAEWQRWVSEPGKLDNKLCAYGRHWDLSDPATIELYSWLIAIGLRPGSVHLGTPCTWPSVLGKAQHPEISQTFVKLTIDTANHQESYEWLCSVENLVGSGLMKLPEWIASFGTIDEPAGRCRRHRSD